MSCKKNRLLSRFDFPDRIHVYGFRIWRQTVKLPYLRICSETAIHECTSVYSQKISLFP